MTLGKVMVAINNMDTSVFLAQVFGLYLVIIGLTVVVRHKSLKQLVDDFIGHKAHVFIVGVLVTIIGLLVVLSHNIWGGETWVTLITVLSWLTLAKGVYYLLTPENKLKEMVKWTNGHGWYIWSGLISIALGIYLLLQTPILG